MKIIYNNFIPFKGFAAINLFGILFVRKGVKVSEEMINHEAIHTAQMKEMFYVIFYLWYIIEYIIRRWNNTADEAYKKISFEREAYANENNKNYLAERKMYNWINFINL